ncbi:tetratricopeptide repeat protein [candidate division KSB1 bacterium]|nr:tetratricopeptide repeat protein [candidate division KSB1 bacterium]
MNNDRDFLKNKAFLQLAEICENRGVILTVVDLRWGVNTDEIDSENETEKLEKKVLDVCFDRIDRCNYFVGILGARYGYIPRHLSSHIIELFDEKSSPIGRSVTELEIIYATRKKGLNQDNMLFCLRDDDYSKSLGADFIEHNNENRQKLKELCDYVKRYQPHFIEGYKNVHVLNKGIFEFFKNVLDRRFPAPAAHDPNELYSLTHYFYALRQRRYYEKNDLLHSELNQFIEKKDQTLLVLEGAIGSGKSSLLANWGLSLLEKNTANVILHFVGISSQSTTWQSTLRHMIYELCFDNGLPFLMPENELDLPMLLYQTLQTVSKKRRVVIVIDGINKFEFENGTTDLFWLPGNLPQNVSIIISTTAPIEQFYNHDACKFKLGHEAFYARGQQRDEFIKQYLDKIQFRELSKQQISKISNHHLASTPKFLVTILESLSLFGLGKRDSPESTEKNDDYKYYLDSELEYYISSNSYVELYERIFDKIEKFSQESKEILRDGLRFIFYSKDGLAEEEVLHLISRTTKSEIMYIDWQPVYLSIANLLVNNSGLLSIREEAIRQAVQKKYAIGKDSELAYRQEILNYFVRNRNSTRKLQEYAWQLSQLGYNEKLFRYLKQRSVFHDFWRLDPISLKKYFVFLINSKAIYLKDIAEHFAKLAKSNSKNAKFLESLSIFLFDLGFYEHAKEIQEDLINQFKTKDKNIYQRTLRLLANSELRLGNWSNAYRYYKKQASIVTPAVCLDDFNSLQKSYGNQAIVLVKMGKSKRALERLEKQENICKDYHFYDGLMKCYGTYANAFIQLRKLKEALEYQHEQEILAKRMNDLKDLHISLGNKAVILQTLGKFEEAFRTHEQEREICLKIGDRYGLQASYGNQGHIFLKRGMYIEALSLYLRQEEICMDISEMWGLQNAYFNIGVAYTRLKNPLKAADFISKCIKICVELHYKKDLRKAKILLFALKLLKLGFKSAKKA